MTDTQPWIALALMMCGLSLIAVSIANRRERAPALFLPLSGLLAVGTVVAWGAVALSGSDVIGLHFAALEWPAAAVLPLALAGAFAFARWKPLRYASVPLAAAGLVAVALGSSSFLHRFAGDPFLTPAAPVTVTTVAADARAEFDVPFQVSALRLSPAGQFVALGSENDDEQPTIHAGPAGGPLTVFTADEAAFVDEGRLLLLEQQRGASVLRVVDLHRENREGWSLRLSMSATQLMFDGASGEWRILGRNDDNDIVSAAGTVGDHAVREERWKTPVDAVGDLEALSVSGGEVLVLETERRSLRGSTAFWQWAAVLRRSPSKSRFWTVSHHGSAPFLASRLGLRCQGASAPDEAATCTVFDGARTGLFAVDPATRRSSVLASVPGRFYLRRDAGPGWILGWLDHQLVLLQAATRQAFRVPEDGGMRVTELAIVAKTIGAASWNGRGSTIRLYSIEQDQY